MARRDVICISHAIGAGGADVGRLVAERLGFRYVDEEIVLQAAERAGLDPEAVADEERRKPLFAGLLDYLGKGADPALAPPWVDQVPPELVRGLIRDAIREVAGQGEVVIVAHAASFALGDDAGPLRVLVTAPPATRAARLATFAELEAREATRSVERSDAARADYLKRFYGIGAEQPVHYDLVLNTERISAEQAAALVVEACSGVVEQRPAAPASG